MRRGGTLAAVAAIGWVCTIVALHLGQIRHDQLSFDPEAIADAAPGEAVAAAVAAVMEHELDSPTGWRPNDFVLWGPSMLADNNANRQLGIILAVRETMRVFKDHLTKVSSDEYDPHLVQADTLFRNDAQKFWFPSAEGRFREGVQHLREYVAGLHTKPPRSKPMNRRNVELIRLFQTWTDMLGDAHAALYRQDVSFFATDDAFYHAQGVAHAMLQVSRALRVEYRAELQERPILDTLFEEVGQALSRAATLKPLVILDGGPASLFANHRLNLDAYVTEARQKMYSVREELEK
ncbi:MAG: hypothetical protein QOD06_3490 [Candidatus Binatota bacterium]|jgi:hypothetical protein|nr:hypothetical protein [Candidatus Binatota bacterium]